MTDTRPEALDPFRRPGSPWRLAVLWALPMGLWLALTGITGVGMFAQSLSWKSDHEDWVSIIDGNRRAGDVGIADAQKETLAEEDRKNLEGLLALVAGFALSLAIAWLYRRKVPRSSRGGRRGLALGIVALGLLAVFGYLLVGVMLRGAITG